MFGNKAGKSKTLIFLGKDMLSNACRVWSSTIPLDNSVIYLKELPSATSKNGNVQFVQDMIYPYQ